MSKGKAVVLLSGGLDSTTALGIALWREFDVEALNIDYGQRHVREVQSAKAVAEWYNIPFREAKLQLPWGGSSLLACDLEVPVGRSVEAMGSGIPNTYVPARNTFLIGLAASFAESIGANAIFLGVNALDYSGYPDCRPEYIQAMQDALVKGTAVGDKGGLIAIHTPLIKLSKAEIVRWAVNIKVPLHLTWSCYKGGEKPCGECDSCLLRAKGFMEAETIDTALSRPVTL